MYVLSDSRQKKMFYGFGYTVPLWAGCNCLGPVPAGHPGAGGGGDQSRGGGRPRAPR